MEREGLLLWRILSASRPDMAKCSLLWNSGQSGRTPSWRDAFTGPCNKQPALQTHNLSTSGSPRSTSPELQSKSPSILPHVYVNSKQWWASGKSKGLAGNMNPKLNEMVDKEKRRSSLTGRWLTETSYLYSSSWSLYTSFIMGPLWRKTRHGSELPCKTRRLIKSKGQTKLNKVIKTQLPSKP